jgi:hypothetical protein|tara:strand:- start:15423 stop:15680 length:258 start_codon:yes stop_codon:yes gene_type:complete
MDNVTEKVYQMVYYLQDESCAGVYTEDELAMLMTHTDVMNSFKFIGNDADVWLDETFRHRVCDKALYMLKTREEQDTQVEEIQHD